MIQVEHLQKEFIVKRKNSLFRREKIKIEAVKDVSLQIEKGKIVGLLGINGAGKTTTIKMLTTLLEPTAGSYSLEGIDAIKNPMMIKGKINMVAGGERMIYWRLTAYENLWYYGQLYGIPNKILKERIEKLLELVGLQEKKDIPVETFSKGMKQRLQIARGLINDPSYLFMDEPTIGLDTVVAKELRGHIQHLAKEEGKGILITSHYMGEMEELCDYIYLLSNGRLVKEGTSKRLAKEAFQQKIYYLKLYQNAEDIIPYLEDKIRGIDSTAEISEEKGRFKIICTNPISRELSLVLAEKNLLIKEMYEQKPSLEETILKLAKEI